MEQHEPIEITTETIQEAMDEHGYDYAQAERYLVQTNLFQQVYLDLEERAKGALARGEFDRPSLLDIGIDGVEARVILEMAEAMSDAIITPFLEVLADVVKDGVEGLGKHDPEEFKNHIQAVLGMVATASIEFARRLEEARA